VDWRDSARFTSIFLASGFSCSQALSRPARQPLTQTVGQPILYQGYNLFMAIVVSLYDFVGEMQMLSDERHAYLNKVTGKLITISDDDFAMAEIEEDDEFSEWQDEFVQAAKEVLSSDNYLKIPSKFDIHEYEIMERFSLYFPEEKVSNVLLGKIRGSGAFHRFKDTIYRYGIEKDWFKFRDEAYKEIAISWLESNDIAYNDALDTALEDK